MTEKPHNADVAKPAALAAPPELTVAPVPCERTACGELLMKSGPRSGGYGDEKIAGARCDESQCAGAG